MTEEIDEIRRRKLEKLRDRAESGTGDEAGSGTPAEPVRVSGEAHLNEFVAEQDVVLVDFYADWCGPCQMLEPVVETLAAETDAAVAKVDVDANQPLAAEYGVQGVPTLLLFAEGQPVKRLVGVLDEAQLRDVIETHT